MKTIMLIAQLKLGFADKCPFPLIENLQTKNQVNLKEQFKILKGEATELGVYNNSNLKYIYYWVIMAFPSMKDLF